jgi:hypothetical protein
MKKIAPLALVGILALAGCLANSDSNKVTYWTQPDRVIGHSWTYHVKEGDFDFHEIKTTINAVNVEENGDLIGRDSSYIYKKNEASFHEGRLVTDSVVVNSAQSRSFRMDNLSVLDKTSSGTILYYTPRSTEGILTETSETESCTEQTDFAYPIEIGDSWVSESDCSYERIAGTNKKSDSVNKTWIVKATRLDTLTIKDIDYQVLVIEKKWDLDSNTREIHYFSQDIQNMVLVQKIKADTLESYMELIDFSL